MAYDILEKFIREEYLPAIHEYTSTNASMDLLIRRYVVKFKSDIDALPAGTVLGARDETEGITKEQIQTFFAILESLMNAQPVGSSDALIAQRVRPMKING